MSPGRADSERIECVIERLLEQKRVHGALTNDVVEQAASRIGVSARTMRPWLSAATSRRAPRDKWAPSPEDELLYFECRGNVAELYRRRKAAGLTEPDVRQLQRAFGAHFTPAERAFAKEGEEGARRSRTTKQRTAGH